MKYKFLNQLPDVFVSTIFVVLISVPFLGLLNPQSKSDTENRNLATMPQLSLHQNDLIKFPKAFEAYVNDHFKFKNNLVNLNSQIHNNFFGISSSKRVVFGKDDWLFYTDENTFDDINRTSYLTIEQKKDWEKSLIDRFTWLKNQNILYRFVVVPDKHSLYPEMMPNNLKINSKPSRWEDLLETIKPSAQEFLIDLIHPLILNKNTKKDNLLYFKTDTHWTNYGAYLGYREIIKSIGRNTAACDLLISQGHSCKRDLADMAGLSITEADHIVSEMKIPTWHYTQIMLPSYGLQNVNLHNISNNGIFATQCEQGVGTAIVTHDSFTQSLRPYLSSSFARVIYVWSYIDDESFINLIEQEKPNVVIEERVERRMQKVPIPNLKKILMDRESIRQNNILQPTKLQKAYIDLIQQNAKLVTLANNQEVIKISSTEYAKILPENGGHIDYLEHKDGIYSFKGWAGLPSMKQNADFVFISKGNHVFFVSDVAIKRPDVALHFNTENMLSSGFSIDIPDYIINSYPGVLRAFAVHDKRIAEIHINDQLLTKAGLPSRITPKA